MPTHLQTLVLARYNQDTDKRVILATYHDRISTKEGNQHVSTIEQLVANDQFVANINYMITDDESGMVIFYNRDDLVLYFAVTDSDFSPDAASLLFKELKRDCAAHFNPIALQNLKKLGLQKQADPILQNMSRIFNDPDPYTQLRTYRESQQSSTEIDSSNSSQNSGNQQISNVDSSSKKVCLLYIFYLSFLYHSQKVLIAASIIAAVIILIVVIVVLVITL